MEYDGIGYEGSDLYENNPINDKEPNFSISLSVDGYILKNESIFGCLLLCSPKPLEVPIDLSPVIKPPVAPTGSIGDCSVSMILFAQSSRLADGYQHLHYFSGLGFFR